MPSSDSIYSFDSALSLSGGKISSHSHRLDMIEAFSFVSAWDLYQISLAEASSIIVIGSSEDPEVCPRACVCACECVCYPCRGWGTDRYISDSP